MTSQMNGDLAATLARNIRAARASQDMTQRELAAALDTDSGVVSKWERAAHAPTGQNLQAIAHVTGREVAWFYTDHRPAEPVSWAGDSELPQTAEAA